MGMHNAADRMRSIIGTLSKFYELRHQALQGEEQRFASAFDPDAEMYDDDRDVDAAYYAYIERLSEGVDEVLAELGVRLDPVPPGKPEDASDETLMAGAHLIKWPVEVYDADSGQFVGRMEWAMYHRHDRFAIPGPAQISYLKARGGRTMMIG